MVSADAILGAVIAALCTSLPLGVIGLIAWGKIRAEVDEVKHARIQDMAAFTKAHEKMEIQITKVDSDSRTMGEKVAVLGQKVDGLIKSVDDGFSRLFSELESIRGAKK